MRLICCALPTPLSPQTVHKSCQPKKYIYVCKLAALSAILYGFTIARLIFIHIIVCWFHGAHICFRPTRPNRTYFCLATTNGSWTYRTCFIKSRQYFGYAAYQIRQKKNRISQRNCNFPTLHGTHHEKPAAVEIYHRAWLHITPDQRSDDEHNLVRDVR